MMLEAEELPGVTAVGAKLAVAPLGRPATLKVTGLEKVLPLEAMTSE
jgi:hypothetical protein